MSNEADLDKLAVEIKTTLDITVRSVSDLLKQIVVSVERIHKRVQNLDSTSKQELATRVAEQYVHLPFPLNMVKRPLLKFLINHAVRKLNEEKGQNWLESN